MSKISRQKTQIDFTGGDIIKNLILFSIPIILGELLQNLYNSADALVVGNLVSERALAAVGVCGVISNLLVNFFNGVSVGSNVIVSRAFGMKKQELLNSSIRAVFSTAVLLGIVLSAIGIVLAPCLLHIAGVLPEYYREALVYLRIYLAGLMFTVVYNNGAGILRALGDTGTPFTILAFSCCFNIVLDLIFVGVLHMGVAGVGLATLVSQGISVVRVCGAINRRTGTRCISFSEIQSNWSTVLSAMDIGMAAGMQSALISFSNLFVVRYMNLFNMASVAGIGIAQRLDKFIILPAKSFGITMTTYVSQNAGAGRYDRVRDGIRKCLLIALIVTLSLSMTVYALSDKCVALFNKSPAVVSTGVSMMHVLIPFFWTMAVREVILGMLRGYKITRIPMLLTLTGMVGIRQLFLAVSMSRGLDIRNIFFCYPAAWVSTLLLLLGYFLHIRHRLPGLGSGD